MCRIKPAQAAPDRDAVDLDPGPLARLGHRFVKGRAALFGDPARDPAQHASQLAVSAAIALGLGFQRTRLALQDGHVVHDLDRNPEPRRCRPVRVTFLDEINDPLAKLHGKWFAHSRPPTSAMGRENRKSNFRGIPNRNDGNLL